MNSFMASSRLVLATHLSHIREDAIFLSLWVAGVSPRYEVDMKWAWTSVPRSDLVPPMIFRITTNARAANSPLLLWDNPSSVV
jgi:hypothetical protein